MVMRKIWCSLFILLSACSLRQDGGAGEYLLPWPDANGVYSLQPVSISTLTRPTEASGPAAEVFVNPTFQDRGVVGPIARPHLARANGMYVPLDVESGLALTAYAIFERLYQFENRVFGPTPLSWPRRVGVETRLLNAMDGSVEVNNARFFGDQNITAFFPYSGPGLPLVLNLSIVSHEHFHSHFQAAVLGPSAGVYAPKSAEELDFTRIEDYNFLVLRAWNEGLADFYAAVFTRAPRMMNESLEFPSLYQRDVSAPFSGFASPAEFRRSLIAGKMFVGPSPRSFCRSVECAYQQGTELARFLYAFAGADQERVLAQIIHNLPAIAQHIQANYWRREWSLEQVVGLLLKDYPATEAQCAQLRAALSPQEIGRSFGPCLVR